MNWMINILKTIGPLAGFSILMILTGAALTTGSTVKDLLDFSFSLQTSSLSIVVGLIFVALGLLGFIYRFTTLKGLLDQNARRERAWRELIRIIQNRRAFRHGDDAQYPGRVLLSFHEFRDELAVFRKDYNDINNVDRAAETIQSRVLDALNKWERIEAKLPIPLSADISAKNLSRSLHGYSTEDELIRSFVDIQIELIEELALFMNGVNCGRNARDFGLKQLFGGQSGWYLFSN